MTKKHEKNKLMSANNRHLTQGLPCHPFQAAWQWRTPRRVLHGRRLHWEHWKQPRPVVRFWGQSISIAKTSLQQQVTRFTVYNLWACHWSTHCKEHALVKSDASYPVKIKGCCILSVVRHISAPPSTASSPMNSNSVPARASIAFETSRMWLQSLITSHGWSLKHRWCWGLTSAAFQKV